MLKRTITGIILVAFVAGFMLCGYFVSTIFIDMLILLFLAGAVYEMFKCLKDAGYKMFVAPPVFLLVAAYPTFYLLQHYVGGASQRATIGVQGLLAVFVASVMICLTIFTFKPAKHTQEEVDAAKAQGIELELDSPKAHELKDLLANVFLLVYPMLFMVLSFVMSYKYSALFAVLFAIFVPTLGDAFAYWIGSTVKGKKLCPKISPKKTISGAVGGLLGAVIVSLVFWLVFELFADNYLTFINGCHYRFFIAHDVNGWQWKTALIYIALGLVIGVLAELGDLAASRIKRAIGIKDYGKIFPGHGGFMDRLDSIMYSIAVLVIAFTCIYGY
ncbi:MAG: phosphatidate cytidylyltransferase [Clostridia bacterium]|nr:phosphatidate cytidylyltransferase [Clostridia bacterium]